MVGNIELIGNINNISSYIVLRNGINVWCKGLLRLTIIMKECLIGEKVKGYAYRYLKIMKECINPTLYAWVVVKGITVKVPKF